jgi:hypothetical protein
MWRDTVVEETRKAREEYAQKFDYDLGAIFRDLKESEDQNRERVVRLRPRRPVSVRTAQATRRR